MMIVLIINLLLLLVVLWNVVCWPEPTLAGGDFQRVCSVLIPARNEQANIAACLETVVKQPQAVGEIIVYDDHSTDDTGAIVREYQKRDSRIRLIGPKELLPGWTGKSFACATLANGAGSEWLLFLDADARLGQDAVGRMISEATARNVTFLSCWPGLELIGFWEKALLPMLNFVVLTLFPAPLSLKRKDASLGLAHGACILARREQYQRIGGHGAVRDEIFEDTSLARIWRAQGQGAICLDGQSIVRVRMYDSLAGIWSGFRKNFYPAFHHVLSFWLFLLLHLFCFLLPPVLLVSRAVGGQWSVSAGLATLSVLAMRASLARRFGHPLWSVLLHPLAEIILLGVGLASWWSCLSGRGVEWKGRIYRAGRKEKRAFEQPK